MHEKKTRGERERERERETDEKKERDKNRQLSLERLGQKQTENMTEQRREVSWNSIKCGHRTSKRISQEHQTAQRD